MTFTPTTNDPLIGKILAERYRITELVGAGRFSIVYKGQHLFMDRAVAMKTLQTNLVEDPTIIKRFEKEAVALSKLRHPNIVSVYDCFVHTNGQPFLVMDFLDGHTLEELLNERGAIPPKLMRAIIFQASAGLAHAHQSGVLHRDIKPDNIILLPREKTDERVRLLDFGFALLQGDLERLTLSGTLCGSPAYISPERWKGKELDARSDIYSLAVVMFQGLTGQLPFKASSLEELRNMHVSQEPPKIGDIVPSLKDDLVAHQVLEKALAKDPEQRYQTMKEFHNAIKQWSPNSDDAEIAQWAKNVAPKPAPKQGQPVAGQPTNGQPAAALPTTAQPISLQPMPSQTVQPQAPAGSPQSNQQASFSPPPGNSQAAASSPATSPPPASPGAKPFDEAATLPNNQTKPGVDDSATLPKSDSAAQAPIPMGADQQPPAKGYVAVDINSHPLSPEALAKIPKPNPRASLTKMDVAYIQAIAKTLGDSLGDEAKSIEITPALEEELAKAPREETTKLDFNSMPPPVVKSTIPEPGPKVTPAVDRRQNRQGEMSQEDIDTLPASTWPAPDMSQSLMPAAKPFGMNRPGGQPNAPAQPPKPVPAPGQAPQATPATPPTPAAPAAKAPEQPVASEWSAKQAVPEKPEQPVPSDWTVKQEVAPWVQNPDDFKPKSGDFSTPQSSRETDTGSASFGAPGSPPPFPMGASQNAAGPAPGFPTGPAEQSPAAASFGASSWAPQTGPVFGQAPPGITPVGAPDSQQPPQFPQSPPSSESPLPPQSPPPNASIISSSRISPILPGSPSPDVDAPGAVPWTNAASSSPVDFGKIFADVSPINDPGISATMPAGIPPSMQADANMGSGADPSGITVNSDRSTPPKGGKKRGRLPTFVDKEVDENADSAIGSAPAKKGGSGMLIAGVAVTVFIFAGIGIATWLLTNVNPSNSSATGNSPSTSATAPNANPSTSNPQPATSTTTPEPTANNAPGDATTATPDSPQDNATADAPAPSSNTGDTANGGTVNDETAKNDAANENSTKSETAADTSTAEPVKAAAPPKPAEAPPKPEPAKPPVTAAKAPPAPKKEEHSTGGWFGFPSFNKIKEEEKKPAPAPVTANVETAKPAAPPKKKKKKPRKIPVAHKAPAASSVGSGYVEVEVSPSRRAYRSY